MLQDDFLGYIDSRQQDHLERLLDYLHQPSVSTDNLGMREAAELARQNMSSIGLDARLVESAGQPFVLGKWLKRPGAPTVLLYGHYDVQPPGRIEEWVTPPFEPTVRDGRIFARGVGDNKGQHFAQLMALESLLQMSGTLPCNILFLLEGEEEVGSPHAAEFIAAHRDELRADLVLVSDGPLHESGRPVIKYGCRGFVSFELSVRCANRDVHSGNFGNVVPNAIWTMVQVLASMKDIHGKVLIEGFYDSVVPLSSLELAAMRNLPIDEQALKSELGIENFDQPLDRPYFERLMACPTLTINGITGGHTGSGVKTIIPCAATAKLDIRLVQAQTVEEIVSKVKAHLQRFGGQVDMKVLNSMLPSKTSMASRFAPAVRSGIAAGQGSEALEYPSGGGSLPLYVFTQILGLDTFLVPYANHDEANHAPNENMKVECYYKGIRTGAAILSRIGALSTADGRD